MRWQQVGEFDVTASGRLYFVLRNSNQGVLLVRMTSLLAAILLSLFSGPLAAKWDQEAKASDLLSRLQLRVEHLALVANDAVDGNLDAFSSLKQSGDDIDGMLHSLEHGDPRSGMSGYVDQETFKKDLAGLDAAWAKLKVDVTTMLEAQQQVIDTKETADEFADKLTVLNSRMDEAVKILVDKDGTKMQVMIATRQMLYADRMQRRVQSIVRGGDDAPIAAGGLQRDAETYRVMLASLTQGNANLNLKAATNPGAHEILSDVNQQWTAAVAPLVSKLLGAEPAMESARHAADEIGIDSQTFILKAEPVSRRLHD
jgi:twitching motility protein PilJ